MSNADTIQQALQGAMVGRWGRENALHALAALEAENQQLRDALELALNFHILARTPDDEVLARLRAALDKRHG